MGCLACERLAVEISHLSLAERDVETVGERSW
jgi:hypothetical protein